MSAKFYAKFWKETHNKIRNVIDCEKGIQECGTVSQPRAAHAIIAELYFRYILIMNNVCDIFDQTLQVQKKEMVKKVLIPVTKRVCELRKQLCEIEMSEFIYIDETLINARSIPHDIFLNCPHNFPMKRSDEYNEIIAKYLRRHKFVQTNEYELMNELLCSVDSRKTQTEFEYIFLGMLENSNRHDLIEFIGNSRENRRTKVELYESHFKRIISQTNEFILNKKFQTIKEDISDFIRNWFREIYKESGNVGSYPSESVGGNILLMYGDLENLPKKLKKPKKSAKKEKVKVKPSPKKQKKAGWDFSELSPTFVKLESVIEEYERNWSSIDETKNVGEAPYMEMILPDKYAEMRRKMHSQVDEQIREEHELLREAQCKDAKKKYKKKKAKLPQKRKKSKKRRKGKGKKKSKSKSAPDLTAGQSTDTLISELIKNGILIDVPKKSLDNFIGDYNYLAHDQRTAGKSEPAPCMGELKSMIRAWLFGMGPLDFEKTKSICILGPPGCGKKHIIYGLIAELGAVVFNLSSEVIAKYKDNLPYFVQLVTKMAATLQPSVLLIDEAHKPFMKKPKEKKKKKKKKQNHENDQAATTEFNEEYTIFGKFLPKMLKSFQSSDRVLLLGATVEPWTASKTKMKKCYEKFVLIPTENYADKYLIWQIGLRDRIGFIPNIEISSLAKVNVNYSVAFIFYAMDRVLTIPRLNRLGKYPLKAEEFMIVMSSLENPPDKKRMEKYRKWFAAASKRKATKEGDDPRKKKK